MKFQCCKITSDDSDSSMMCNKCKHNYHMQCLYPNDKKAITNQCKKSWLCPECSSKQPRQLNKDNTPVRVSSRAQLQNTPDKVTATRGGCNTLSPPSPSIYDYGLNADVIRNIVASEMSKIKDDISSQVQKVLALELKPIRDEINSLKSSVTYFNEQFESLSKRIENVEKGMKECKIASSNLSGLKSNVMKIEKNINNNDQWSRRSNIEIYGIPKKKNENLLDILKIICNRIQHNVDPGSEIDFITRVAPKQADSKKIKPIVIRFLARYKKDDFLSRARKSKLKASDIGYTGCNNSVYFNEHLTSFNKSLLRQTKSLAKEKQYAFVWVKNCAIFARRNDTSSVIAISDEQDLNKLK